MRESDDELIRLVLDDEDFKNAATIGEVKGVVRRVLRKRLIDIHLEDSEEVSVRQCLVNRHLEWISLKILLDVDGILVIPEHLDDLDNFRLARERK